MTSPLFAVLARTLTQSSLAEPARLESRVHGMVPLRASFIRREVVKDRMNGEVPMLDGETLASINEIDAPHLEKGDLLWISSALWQVASALADGGGLVKLQLLNPQYVEATKDSGEAVKIVVAGEGDLEDLEAGEEIVALTNSTAFRVRQRRTAGTCAIEVEGDTYRVLMVEPWEGSWRRLTLARA
ncbi:hypothetical protein [Methylobacterium sp. Leaf85]|uniref:hypothetical protein n=1 Tax=Methylobacterium sp. Leaf85 TaxID=1736241 RepID=UPI0006F208AB|nr:hypothetical protein [Methylobacterium sp. Leaf85]KQO49755.1 hypothetical protein ASF08_22945 [Methylobacterium sp. Leaf85]